MYSISSKGKYVYEEVKKFLSIVTRKRNVSIKELNNFYASVSEADNLFGPEIREYIDEIHKHACKLGYWNDEYRDNTQPKPEGYDHNKVAKGISEEFDWLSKQFEPAKEKFRKYLYISD